MVGCAKIASRSEVYGSFASMAVCTTAVTSPASVPKAVNPRISSLSALTSAFRKPRVSESVCVRAHLCHRNLCEPIRDRVLQSFRFVQTYAHQFRIGEYAEWNQPALSSPVPPVQVVVHNSEIVGCNVREMGLPAHSPIAQMPGAEVWSRSFTRM